ncbi:hypothetical protein [Candidatus Hecatella orcuttiae]|jgi:hypothetical protein|uniref:hypothetical protein n=1 Tax=Candidatus Hecatella orcuttiae TaxID=1935119 RepID=UPI002867B705|nr:hypothetical protein [Candidatus Hecatella orcuttiae]
MTKTSEEKEELKRLLESKKKIEKRISRHQNEIEHLKTVLGLLDKLILERSYKVAAELPRKETPPSPPEAAKEVFSLTARDGTLLANVYLAENFLKAVPEENLKLNVNTPPFQQFLVRKVLNGMAAQDREAVSAGKIDPGEALSFRVKDEGGLIKEITVENYRDQKRLATLKNALRWTLEKMYEKTKI